MVIDPTTSETKGEEECSMVAHVKSSKTNKVRVKVKRFTIRKNNNSEAETAAKSTRRMGNGSSPSLITLIPFTHIRLHVQVSEGKAKTVPHLAVTERGRGWGGGGSMALE
jgi:hypothetical protein